MSFAEQLRADLVEQEVRVAELARRWNPNDPITSRRLLHKYLAGAHQPRASTRRRIALALGFEADHYLEEIAA